MLAPLHKVDHPVQVFRQLPVFRQLHSQFLKVYLILLISNKLKVSI